MPSLLNAKIANHLTRLPLILALVLTSVVASAEPRFVENHGLLLINVESVPPTGSWSEETSIGGFTGSSYYIWRGDNFFNPADAGMGTIRYQFRINTPGNYQMRWRSRIGQGNLGSEHNDTWIRFPTGSNIGGEHGLNGWTKVYMGHLNQWHWDSLTVDFVGNPIRQFFSAGDHFFEISGRSTAHAIDRFSLFRYESVPFSEDRFTNSAESPRVDGDQPAPVLTPVVVEPPPAAPDPAPITIVAEPVDAIDAIANSDVAPAVALRADVYSSSAAEVFWSPGSDDVASFNVHLNGEFLDSTDGTSYFMAGLQPDNKYNVEVYAVSADSSVSAATSIEFQTRAEFADSGNPASSDDASGSGATGPGPQAPANLSLTVYSATAAELFWDRAAVSDGVVGADIYRDGLFIGVSEGTSLYDDTRGAGEQYTYEVFAKGSDGSTSIASSVAE